MTSLDKLKCSVAVLVSSARRKLEKDMFLRVTSLISHPDGDIRILSRLEVADGIRRSWPSGRRRPRCWSPPPPWTRRTRGCPSTRLEEGEEKEVTSWRDNWSFSGTNCAWQTCYWWHVFLLLRLLMLKSPLNSGWSAKVERYICLVTSVPQLLSRGAQDLIAFGEKRITEFFFRKKVEFEMHTYIYFFLSHSSFWEKIFKKR